MVRLWLWYPELRSISIHESLYGTMGRGIPRAFLSDKEGEKRGRGIGMHGSPLWTRMVCGVEDRMCDVMRGFYGRGAA